MNRSVPYEKERGSVGGTRACLLQSATQTSGDVLGIHPSKSALQDVIFISKTDLNIRERIGRGSFGTVYRGHLYDEDVAVKVLNVKSSVSRLGLLVDTEKTDAASETTGRQIVSELVAALEKEVRVLKSVCCEHIVTFHGICLEPPAIITEYCVNESLFDFIAEARRDSSYADRLTWETRLRIACDVARGMKYMHFRENQPALHRDLKSPNLVLDENMKCKICDFNLSRFVETKVAASSIAANNPYWLAPEILQGLPFQKASDVYPFGTILWELMTWMFPYEVDGEPRNNAAVMFGAVFRNERPHIPPNDALIGGPCPVYDDYCALITRCWNGVPDERPSFVEIVDVLEGFRKRVEKPLLRPIISRCSRLDSDALTRGII